MKKTECAELLKEISAIDNRQVNFETVEAWFAIIGHIPLDIARQALHLARKDDRINYLEPRHIVSWAKEAAFKLDREQGNLVAEPVNSVPQPICREHGLGIMDCVPCCRAMKHLAYADKNTALRYAKEHIFA